jgi:PPK2 family polyphosphate:nucleotide phosphotransferase
MADIRAKRIAELIKPLRVKPGSKVNLAKDFDPGYKAGFLKKKDGIGLLQTGISLLADYQRRLAAQDTYGVLVCLQALDAGGKDGTIRHVMSGVNPQGVHVSGFKVPSAEELDHDYLWRYAARLPTRGEIGIFNRSHYEEVLVVRVHPENLDRQKLPAEAKGKGVWDRRYREINDWEHYLTDNGLKVVKLFLNLSKEEQRTRFLKRIDLPEKNWKFSAADVRERRRWDDYQKAFSEMLSATSTHWAPWYVIPADRKWFARICAAAVLAHTLIEIDPQYPVVSADRRQQLQAVRGELEAEAPKGAPADPFAAKEAREEAKAAAAAEAKAAAAAKTAARAEAKAARQAAAAAKTAAEAEAKAVTAAKAAAEAAAGQVAGDGQRPKETDGQAQPARAGRTRSRAAGQGRAAQAAPRSGRTRGRTATQDQAAQAAPQASRTRGRAGTQDQAAQAAPQASRTRGRAGTQARPAQPSPRTRKPRATGQPS